MLSLEHVCVFKDIDLAVKPAASPSVEYHAHFDRTAGDAVHAATANAYDAMRRLPISRHY